MPLMMEDDMDIDDLFGDGGALPLPSRPPPRQLYQRLDELRGSGCCQGIAWSRLGSIASITSKGTGLEFHSLRCHPREGTWDISDSTSVPQSLDDGEPLQHLCWSPSGNDLAVIDAAGRISILTIHTSMNRPNFTRSGQVDALDELNAIVGTFWLNLAQTQQRPPFIHKLATKLGSEYHYDMAQSVSLGPCHPNPQKSALVSVTTTGALRLLWPQADGKWYETTTEIENVVSSDDLITHASICAEKNKTLLIAFATTTKQLCVVRVKIDWGIKPPIDHKSAQSAQTMLNPQVIVRHLAITNWMNGLEGSESFHMHSSMAALSHLTILPPSPDGPDGHPTLPNILTVRSHLPTSPTHYNQDTQSIVGRWELRESAQEIHPAFDQLNSRRNSTAAQPGMISSLKRLDGFTVGKVIITVDSVALDRILCFCYSDGTIEYRDRSTLSELFMEGGPDKFSHISQVGFSFNDDEPCLQIALSPTSCSATKMGTNGKLRWKALEYQAGQGASVDDAQYLALVAGLAMICSTAIMNSLNHDDLVAIVRTNLALSTLSSDWLLEISRILKFYVDYSEESFHDALIRNPSIQFSLSIQSSLGFSGRKNPRTFASKIASLALQTRNCVVLMTMAASMKVPDPEQHRKISGLEDADAVRMLTGSVRWCFDLVSYVIDCLLHPANPKIFQPLLDSSTPLDITHLNKELHASNNIALHILLSSPTRGFLTAVCRRLAHLDNTARKAMSVAAQTAAESQQQGRDGINGISYISNELRSAYTGIAILTDQAVVNVRSFETFLMQISDSIKEAYANAGLAATNPTSHQQQHAHDKTRNSIEQEIIFGGLLPEALVPAIQQLFTTFLPALRTELDPSKLFFSDYSLLNLVEADVASKMSWAALSTSDDANAPLETMADIFQRTPIVLHASTGISAQEGRRYRRCVRCAAVMEDVNSRRPAVAFLIMQQRRCYCGAPWLVLAEQEMIA